jgi:hypothetical protein
MRTVIILIVGVFILIAGVVFMVYNKNHRTVEDEEYLSIEALKLFNDFSTNEAMANEQYLDKVLEVTGEISEMITNQSGETIILLKTDDPIYGVSCTMHTKPDQITPGSRVTIKGICTGYLSDVVITRGVLVVKKIKNDEIRTKE